MADLTRRDIDEWRLGIEPSEHPRIESPPPRLELPPPDLSANRLDAPLSVVTAEHLGWAIVALYALITRLGALGLRPLSSTEASDALFASDIRHHGLTALAATSHLRSGWLDPLRAAFFTALGPSDFGARIVAAVFGLALIGAAFAMRRRLGRAGALAFAAMLTLSPTVTYFSRSTSPSVPAIALIIIAIALVFALVGATDTAKVAGLAMAIALALSSEAIVVPMAAMFILILILFAIWELVFGRNPMIRFRVWWERHSAQFFFCTAIAIGLFIVFESAFGRRNFLVPVLIGAITDWLPLRHPDFHGGLAFYLPALAFYEFAIVIAGLLGVVAFLACRIRSRMAAVAFLWTTLSAAFFLADPARHPPWLLMMLVPTALIGAAAIDWIHHTNAWRLIRFPIVALALLTAYVQLAVNFVHVGPDSTEAPWARHMLLFWTEPATTMQTRVEFSHAERAVTDRGAVFFSDPNPVARWYLRELKPADRLANAEVVVSPASAEKQSNLLESTQFTFEEKWNPNLAGLKPESALRYFFTQLAWSEVSSHEIRVDVRAQPPSVVPLSAGSPSTPPSSIPAMEVSPEGTPSSSASAAMPATAVTATATSTEALTPPATSSPSESRTAVPSPGSTPIPPP